MESVTTKMSISSFHLWQNCVYVFLVDNAMIIWNKNIFLLLWLTYIFVRSSLIAQLVKNLLVVQETWVQSLGGEDPVEKEMATHSSLLAWKIPWTEESGGFRSMGHRVRHDWATNMDIFVIVITLVLWTLYLPMHLAEIFEISKINCAVFNLCRWKCLRNIFLARKQPEYPFS